MYLTWEQLDACNTSSEVAELLKKNGIKGIPGSVELCPLAWATSYKVQSQARWIRGEEENAEPLTIAEKAFVEEFDHGKWQELSLESWRRSSQCPPKNPD